MNILKYDWHDTTAPWTEDDIQAAIVRVLRQRGIMFAADQNAGKRSKRDGARRKALGMAAGELDLRLYFDGGRTVFVEVKCKARVSTEQRQRIAGLEALGFECHILRAATPAQAVDEITTIVEMER